MTDDLGSTITVRREADRVIVAVDGCECRLRYFDARALTGEIDRAAHDALYHGLTELKFRTHATCPECGQRVPLRKDGTLGLHTVTSVTPFSDEPQEVGCAGSWTRTRGGEVAP